MLYLLLSILSSSAIMVTFKYFERYKVNINDAVAINYWIAIALTFSLNKHNVSVEQAASAPWFYNAMVMGIMFILSFMLIGISTRKMGVSVTTVANKMSLIVPVIFAVLILGDRMEVLKAAGVAVAFLAVYLTFKKGRSEVADKRFLFLPVMVFVSSGFIDTFFKYNEEYTLGPESLESFMGWIFITAALVGIIIMIRQYIKHKHLPDKRAFLGATVLGLANYFSIYFLLKTLSIDNIPSSVLFPVNNMGIIAVSSVAGIILFKEKLSRQNIIGLVLCLIAIGLISAPDVMKQISLD